MTDATPPPRRRNITAEDIEAARRLKAEWAARAPRLGLTQDRMAEKLGGTQALVSQYLHGKIQLNFRALLAFCAALEIAEPAIIRSDLPEQS
jgi:predicted transcriptional regulator